ncbi:MAG: hypothetical protein ACRC35_05940 [Angustibacter sp.]
MRIRSARTVRSSITVLAVAAMPLALTSCSGDGDEAAGKPSPSRSAPSLVTPLAEKIVNEPGARKDVTVVGCAKQDGGWGAKGQIRNTGKADASYTVVVSFTNAKSTVLARDTTKVAVAAGKTKNWSTTARFKAPKEVVCVLRGVDKNAQKS